MKNGLPLVRRWRLVASEVRRGAQQIGDVVFPQAGQSQSLDMRLAHDVRQRVAEVALRHVLGVAECGHDDDGHVA